MIRLRRLYATALVVALPLVAAAGAQQLPVRDIPAPTKEIADPFSLISLATEMKTGQIVVYDAVESELALVDFAKGTRTPIGRQGSGPGEYRAVGGVYRMQGDTLWVLDAAQMRIVTFTPSLEPGPTIPFMIFDAATSTALTAPMLADPRGRIYASAMKIDMGQAAGGNQMQMRMPDTVSMVRVDPRGGAARAELARVRFPTSGQPQMERNGNSLKFSMKYPGLVAADSWTVFPNGRIAIVRGATYAVQFIGTDGTMTPGVRVAYEPFRVTDADKKAEMDEARRQMQEQNKVVQRMLPANVQMTFDLQPPESWPEQYPAVSPLGVLPGPDGRLWVKRNVPTRIGREQWDVLDQSARLVARWRLPARTSLIGVGQGVLYTIRTDEDDLRYVQTVTLPR